MKDNNLASNSACPTSPLFPSWKVLMCAPDYFDVKYEINPWMHLAVAPDFKAANLQWQTLHHTLIRLGAWVEYIKPAVGWPDMVFTANAGLIKGDKVVMSAFRYPQRQGESAFFEEWFVEQGFEIFKLRHGSFEGEGDAFIIGTTLFAGCGFRSEAKVYEEIRNILEISTIAYCDLVDPRFYHLDTCFAPLDERTVVVFPDAFSRDSLDEMRSYVDVLEIPEEDALKFACNMVVLGSNVVIPAGCDRTMTLLRARGFTPYPVELGEFMKAGGAAKCLTLFLRR